MNLKELSEKLGLSQTTVSRALNGYPEVSEATRKRVMETAERFDYAPNTRAKGLATGRAMAIGHVIATKTTHEMVNPVFGDFIAGAGEVYSEHGYDMILSIVDDQAEADAYRALAQKHTVDGVILHGPLVSDDRITLVKDLGLPFVVHGRTSDGRTDYSWCDVNNRTAFLEATEYLIGLGHQRIALVNGLETMDFAYRRRKGYLDALSAAGIAHDPKLMLSEEMTENLGYNAACTLLDSDTPPTAFLAASLIPTIGIRRAINERGLRIGQDVSVVTFDDELSYFDNGATPPQFTAVRSSVREAGREVAKMLIHLISHPDAPPQSRLLQTELVPGHSSGPAPKT